MMKALLAASMLALASFAATGAQADNWQRIGAVTFDDPFTKVMIDMPRNLGPVSAVRFAVTGADVEVADLKLTYGNGQVDDVAVRDVFRAGSTSRAIPLPGRNGRALQSVMVVYRAHGKAQFQIFAALDAGGGGGGGGNVGWTQLGCQPVGFVVDHDAISVGGQDGGFKAIRLRVEKAPVEIFEVIVTFGNGQHQKLSVRAAIPAGGTSRPIDLAGQVRGIKRIDLLYRSIPTFKGQALVCADGLAAQ
jgi:hypothetical protein